MGLADRDYMRRTTAPRAVSASGPPEASAGLTLLMIVLFMGATYGAYAAWRWWQPPRVSAPVPLLAAPAEPTRQPSVRKSPSQQPPLQQPPARNEERGTGSIEGKPAARGDGTVRITKCVVNGATTYSDGECPPQASRSIVTVDKRQNLADGLPPAARSFAQPSAAAQPPVGDTAPSVADPNVRKKSLCLAYEEDIKVIDARARQPLPGWEQDRLAARRKAARDEQFRLRC